MIILYQTNISTIKNNYAALRRDPNLRKMADIEFFFPMLHINVQLVVVLVLEQFENKNCKSNAAIPPKKLIKGNFSVKAFVF